MERVTVSLTEAYRQIRDLLDAREDRARIDLGVAAVPRATQGAARSEALQEHE